MTRKYGASGVCVGCREKTECRTTCGMPVYACQECIEAGKILTCLDCADNFR